MNNRFLGLILGAMFLTILCLIGVVSRNTEKAFGEVNAAEATIATSTPFVVDRQNLCPANLTTASSTSGVFDSITINAPLVGDLLILDATTTNSALRFPVATSSNVILWLPSGYGTSTPIKLGVEFSRGLIVDYGSVASTTITYRCLGQTY